MDDWIIVNLRFKLDKLQYIQEQLLDAKLRDELAKVVADVDALIPQSEEEFMELRKPAYLVGTLHLILLWCATIPMDLLLARVISLQKLWSLKP